MKAKISYLVKNAEVAALKRLQLRSGRDRSLVHGRKLNLDMPGENSASLEQLAYCMDKPSV